MTNQSGQITQIKFKTHTAFLMMRLIGRMDHRMTDEFTGDFRGLRQTTPRHNRPTHGGGVSVPGAMRHIRQLVVDQLTLARDAVEALTT